LHGNTSNLLKLADWGNNMKKLAQDFTGARGSLPPQLFEYIDMKNIRAETDAFVNFMNAVSDAFIRGMSSIGDSEKIDKSKYERAISDIRQQMLSGQLKLFGQNLSLDYIASGTMGSVFKIVIGNKSFAFKINRQTGHSAEIQSIDIQNKAKNLANKVYIGYHNGENSWAIMDFVEKDTENSFDLAMEKIFYKMLTKGLSYDDWATTGNIKGGKVVDMGGFSKLDINLSRTEIDDVKKFVFYMKSNDEDKFRRLADKASPKVIRYLFIKMSVYIMGMPRRFEKFNQIISGKNQELELRQRTVSENQNRS
jgi:hypothetical protein